MLAIIHAETPEHIEAARELMLEYAQSLGFNLCFQGFDEELRTLPGKYALPHGRLLLALWNGQIAGMGALRPLHESGVCEMKRLFVRPGFRGHAIGRTLALRLIREAHDLGYLKMRLDTVPGKMDEAIALYRQLGFRTIAPYYASPVEHTLFMEIELASSSEAQRAV
ncbi:MAG TPA: GNAT family N-acetyltransferase [Candidatus Angelobacter sp.]